MEIAFEGTSSSSSDIKEPAGEKMVTVNCEAIVISGQISLRPAGRPFSPFQQQHHPTTTFNLPYR
jgi:hypothetical protein